MQQWHQIKFFFSFIFSCLLEHWGGKKKRGSQFQFDKKQILRYSLRIFLYINGLDRKKMTHFNAKKYKKLFQKLDEKLHALHLCRSQKWI